MKSLWLAGGTMALVLSIAVLLRPADRSNQGVAWGSRIPIALGAVHEATHEEEAAAEAPEVVPPRALGADDWARIVELRAQFGSAMDRVSGDKVAQAAFERELKQVAGLAESPASETEAPPGQNEPISDANSTPDSSDRPSLLRRAAAALDELASQAEEARDYPRADQLRRLSDGIRRVRRNLLEDSCSKEDRLIDNAPASQSK